MTDEPEETTPAPEESSPEDSSPPPQDDLTTPTEDDATSPPADGPVAIGQGKLSEKDDKTFGMLAHLLGIFTGFVAPLVIWLIKKEESPFVEDQAKEALNFQILMTIGYIVSNILISVFIGCLLLPAFLIISLIFGIIATMKANEGVVYRYPFSLRIIK